MFFFFFFSFILWSECDLSVCGFIRGEFGPCGVKYFLHILGTPMALNISELSVHFFGFNMKHLSCCWIFLQLDIHLHDRRKISGQLEYPSQCRGFRFQNENLARYFKIPIKIFDFTFSVMSLI